MDLHMWIALHESQHQIPATMVHMTVALLVQLAMVRTQHQVVAVVVAELIQYTDFTSIIRIDEFYRHHSPCPADPSSTSSFVKNNRGNIIKHSNSHIQAHTSTF